MAHAEVQSEPERYEATRKMLNDPDVMVDLYNQVVKVEKQDSPSLVFLQGSSQMRNALRVGLQSGSFNPLTLAHIAQADAASTQMKLDVVVWTCAVTTTGKEHVERAFLPDRLTQILMYTRERAGTSVAVSNRGLYVEQALLLKSVLGPEAEIYVLIGFDKIAQIFDARYYQDREKSLSTLFSLARLAVIPRGGATEKDFQEVFTRSEYSQFREFVTYVPVPARFAYDSSTEARTLAAQTDIDEQALGNLLPPEGLALAHETGAYTRVGSDIYDSYTLRQMWIRALAQGTWPSTRGVAELSTLVQASEEESLHGLALRRWLTGERWPGGPLSVYELINDHISLP